MKERIFYSYLIGCLCIAGLTSRGFAQTITPGTITQSSTCPGVGGAVAISFTVSGTFVASNVFSAQLSDITGAFSASSPIIGTVARTTGGTINATIPASTASGTGYRIRISSSNPVRTGSTSLATLTITTPVAPGTSPAPIYCEGATASALVATPSAGGTLNWYGTTATGGTASATPSLPNTTIIGSTPYYVSQTVGGCESPRVAISVLVKDRPNAPATSPANLCVGKPATPLTATPQTSAALNWYGTNAIGGTASSVAPTPATTSAGTATYYVSQTLNGCEGPRASLVVTVNATPAAPTATAPLPYCEGVAAPALSAIGQNLKWYGSSAVSGSGSSAPTPVNTTIVGTTNYYVSQTVGGCESSRTAIAVTVKPRPSAPMTTAAPSYCPNQSATALVAAPSAGATLNWYGTAAIGGTVSASATTPSTVSAGTTNYYVSQTLNGCEGPRVTIAVTVKPTPTAPSVASPLIACQNRMGYALTATPSSGGTLQWYGTAATGGTATSTPSTLSTSTLGSTTYFVSQVVTGCEGPRAALTVTTNAVPALPSTGVPGAYCEGATPQALSASGQSLKWYGPNATGGSSSGTPTVPATSIVGTTNYYVTQTVNGCESDRAAIPVLIKDTPNAPITAGIDFCQGSAVPTLTATLVAAATPKWYGTNAGGGTATDTAPVPTNTTVGTTTYYVSQVLAGCEGPRASLSVRVKAIPGAPGVSPISFCNNGPAQQLTATGSNLKWYTSTDSPLGGPPTPNTGSVGNQVFKVSQTSNENCEGPKANLTVIINPSPGQPGVSNLNYCQVQQDQPPQNLSPLNASGQNLKWYTGDNRQLGSAPTPSIDRAGTQSYQVSQTVNNCESAKATIQVTINAPAAPALPKSLVVYCINEKAVPLEAVGEAGSQLKWIDPYGRVTNEAPTPSTLNTNIKADGDEFYVYQITSGGCYSARSTIRAIVNTVPTLALLAPTASVNLGQKAPLRLRFTGSGPYSYSLTGGYIGTSRSSDTTIAVLPRGNTTYQVASVTNACGLGLPGNPATATILVRIPTVATSSLMTSTLCAGTSLTVPFTTTGEFNQGNTFGIEVVSAGDTSKKYEISAASAGSPITGPLPLTLASGQYYVRVKANNPEIGVVGSNSPTLLTVRSLPTASLTGSQETYEGIPANLTFTFGGDGPWMVAYADSVSSYSATASASPYMVEIRPSRTTTYRLTRVTNNCGNGAISGTATVSVLTLLGVDDNSLDQFVKAYPVPTETTLVVELNMPLTRDPATLSLTDTQGRPVMHQKTRKQLNELDLTTQPTGLYILRIQVGDRQTIRKVLKQ